MSKSPCYRHTEVSITMLEPASSPAVSIPTPSWPLAFSSKDSQCILAPLDIAWSSDCGSTTSCPLDGAPRESLPVALPDGRILLQSPSIPSPAQHMATSFFRRRPSKTEPCSFPLPHLRMFWSCLSVSLLSRAETLYVPFIPVVIGQVTERLGMRLRRIKFLCEDNRMPPSLSPFSTWEHRPVHCLFYNNIYSRLYYGISFQHNFCSYFLYIRKYFICMYLSFLILT